MEPTTNPIKLSEGAMKTIGISAGAIAVLTFIGVMFFVYKNVLDSTKTRLEITRLKRELGSDAPNGVIDRVTGRIV